MSHEYKSFDISAVTIKKSLTEYHHLINIQAYGLFSHSSLWLEICMEIQSLVYFYSF